MNKYIFVSLLFVSGLAHANGNLVCAQGDRPQSYYDQNNSQPLKTATFDVDMAASNNIRVNIRLNSDDAERIISSTENAALTKSYNLMLACGIWLGVYKYKDESLELKKDNAYVKAVFKKGADQPVVYTCDQN